jgi:predicted xylose isomerase-like sugar epimerase
MQKHGTALKEQKQYTIILFADNQVIIEQDKDDAEYDKKIKRIQEMGFKCTYFFNPLAPSDPYMGRTAQLTSRGFILNTYSTNIHTEYFKRAA